MTSVVHDEAVLTTDERAAWDGLMDRVNLESRYEMARALTDDVRPAWDAFLADAAKKDDPWADWDSA